MSPRLTIVLASELQSTGTNMRHPTACCLSLQTSSGSLRKPASRALQGVFSAAIRFNVSMPLFQNEVPDCKRFLVLFSTVSDSKFCFFSSTTETLQLLPKRRRVTAPYEATWRIIL